MGSLKSRNMSPFVCVLRTIHVFCLTVFNSQLLKSQRNAQCKYTERYEGY
jgi:hypothetical protein